MALNNGKMDDSFIHLTSYDVNLLVEFFDAATAAGVDDAARRRLNSDKLLSFTYS